MFIHVAVVGIFHGAPENVRKDMLFIIIIASGL